MKLLFNIFGLAIILASCTSNAYNEEVNAFRKMKNEEFINPLKTPLSKEKRKSFKSLSYFEINERFKAEATLIKHPFTEYINLFPGSEKVKQRHEKVGVVHFMIGEDSLKLTAYRTLGQASHVLFIPFTDESNSVTTYGGGRYVEAVQIEGDKFTLDFNYAYHPYCVYNEKFSCAICPKENHLNLSINAGEKL